MRHDLEGKVAYREQDVAKYEYPRQPYKIQIVLEQLLRGWHIGVNLYLNATHHETCFEKVDV